MVSTDAQVRKLMDELAKGKGLGMAAARAGMDRTTARRYVALGKLPSAARERRTWRTREDPFEAHWPEIERLLGESDEWSAVTLFEHLQEKHGGVYTPGQLRTLQRRLKRWRAMRGPAKEIFFPQDHRPGEAMQTDFTSTGELGITIAGEAFRHLLCHPVLPFSNWEWVTVCFSESMEALKRGVQEALFHLGCVPRFHQTDHSTAATHDLGERKRAYNREYLELMAYFGLEPRTTAVGAKEQNGDVEASHGAFKRRVRQQLLLRGIADFATVEEYERFLQEIAARSNARRAEKVAEELLVMRPLCAVRLPDFVEKTVPVSACGTIRIKNNTYSVPSRLKHEEVRVRIFEDRLEVGYGGETQVVVARLRGEGRHRIQYRHVIDSLVRKPGAFERYRYREDLFPSGVFRDAHDRLREALETRRADLEYLRILHLAARTMESDVEAALIVLLVRGDVPRADLVREAVEPREAAVPLLEAPAVDLLSYDELLMGVAGAAS